MARARVLPRTVLALCLSAISPLAAPAGASRPASQDGDVRSVDFLNFVYASGCMDDTPISVRNGEYVKDDGDDKVYFSVTPHVVYGDLTGDGRDEAVVLTNCNTGGTGQFSTALVFGMKNGKPALLAELPIGDRADGGVHAVEIANGFLVVERYGHGPSAGACCPEFVETEPLRLSGSKLVAAGRTRRSRFVAYDDSSSPASPQTIKFDAGASSAKVSGVADAPVAFRLGARAGQTMTVRVHSRQGNGAVTVAAPSGRAVGRAVEGESWTGALPESGTFALTVSATGNAFLAYTLEVSIR